MTEEKKPVEEVTAPVVEETPVAEASVKEEGFSNEDLEIIRKELDEVTKREDYTNEEFKKEFEKLKETSAKLSEQALKLEEERKVIEERRKGYATIGSEPASHSAPPEKSPEEKFKELSQEEKYALFEQQFMGRK